MTQGISSRGSASCYELLSDLPFPAFPFSDPKWIGFVFNRDLYGAAGVPKDVFESVLAASTRASDASRLIFEPGVTPLGDHPRFPTKELSGWDEYLAFLKTIDFCPEYYLATADRSVLFWFDPDAVVVGGTPEVIGEAAEHLGGMDSVMYRSADEFGVAIDDPSSNIAAYVRNLGRDQRGRK